MYTRLIDKWEDEFGAYQTIYLCVSTAKQYTERAFNGNGYTANILEKGLPFYKKATELLEKFIGPLEYNLQKEYDNVKSIYEETFNNDRNH